MMTEEKQLYIVDQLVALQDSELVGYAEDWLMLARILIRPTFLQVDQEASAPFSLARVRELLAGLDQNSDFWLTVGDSENIFVLHATKGDLLEKIIVTETVWRQQEKVITDYQLRRLQAKGLYGYVRSYQEYLTSNTAELAKRELFEAPQITQQLPKMRDLAGQIIVDCNQLPGYDIFYKGLCLTACWKMYFTKHYYDLFFKALLLEVQQVERINELGSDVIEITLFSDPFNWQHPANLAFQELFRDQMGYDQLVWNNGVGVLKDPFIEFAYQGNVLQTVQYQNNRLQPTPKKAATHFVTRTYDRLADSYREKRVFGLLNMQAYFPWVDEKHDSMMNYKVLNPQLTLDDGLNAYEYYIRSHLEIEINDERYQNYTTVLQLFIPAEKLQQLPLEQLRERLRDITIGKIRKGSDNIRFDLQKGQNHLRVIFAQQQELEQLEEPKLFQV